MPVSDTGTQMRYYPNVAALTRLRSSVGRMVCRRLARGPRRSIAGQVPFTAQPEGLP